MLQKAIQRRSGEFILYGVGPQQAVKEARPALKDGPDAEKALKRPRIGSALQRVCSLSTGVYAGAETSRFSSFPRKRGSRRRTTPSTACQLRTGVNTGAKAASTLKRATGPRALQRPFRLRPVLQGGARA